MHELGGGFCKTVNLLDNEKIAEPKKTYAGLIWLAQQEHGRWRLTRGHTGRMRAVAQAAAAEAYAGELAAGLGGSGCSRLDRTREGTRSTRSWR